MKRFLVASVVFVAIGNSMSLGRPDAPDQATREYARTIREAQADLDQGRIAEARKRLEAAPKSLRSLEHVYLMARLAAAGATGAAPDLVRSLAFPDVETRCGVLNEINRQLVFICRDGGMRVADLSMPAVPPNVPPLAGGGAIWSGTFSRDGSTFAAGHEAGIVVIWDAKKWTIRHRIPIGEGQPVRELVLAPDGSAVVAEGKSELELWSISGDEPKKIAGVGERYNFGEGLAFSPQGDTIATGGMFDIILHNAKTGERLKAMRHASYTMGLEFSPDGKQIASAPRANVNKFLSVFDIAQSKPLFNAGPFSEYVAGMAFTPDGKRVATTGCAKFVRLFDAATGEVMLDLTRPDCGAKPGITRDGRLFGWSEPKGYKYIDFGKQANAGR